MNNESCNKLLTPHFSESEFSESATARKHGIVNNPPPVAVENLRSLCVNTLEPLREEMGLPIIITSGYRSKALNNLLIHSSRTSQHMTGNAADFYVGWTGPEQHKPSRRELLIRAFRLMITSKQIDFDQLILYPNFIHVSFVSRNYNRHKLTKANGHGTYCALSREAALSII